MGCGCYNFNIENITLFNNQYIKNDKENNTSITLDIIYCRFKYIGQKGFEDFCKLKLENIQELNLSYNQICNIDCFISFKAPNLKILELECNEIVKIDIFQKVDYPLEELDLRYNKINDIKVFEKDTILPKLKILLLTNNDFDVNDEEIKNTFNNIKNRMKKNNEKSEVKYDKEEKYKNILYRVKTMNDKFINDPEKKINVFGQNSIDKLENLKKNIKDNYYIKEIDELISDISKLNESIKEFRSNTLKLSNKSQDIDNSRSYDFN